jgi:membrane protein implicated in regulation of membrane protease activity
MHDLNQPLRAAFLFQPADLRANRAGQISQRQTARLRAGSIGMRLGMAVFVLVMLGTLAIIALSTLQMGGGSSDALVTVGVLGAVVLVVIVIGWLTSRGYMAAARSRQINVARGPAAVVAENVAQNNIKIKIGTTTLRLLTLEQLSAFQPGSEYRVYYLAGPVPTILSAEVVGSQALADGPDEPALEDGAMQQAEMQTFKRGYAIVIVIGILALAIPAVGILGSSLPAGLRSIIWVILVGLAVGIVPLALWWLGSRQRQP